MFAIVTLRDLILSDDLRVGQYASQSRRHDVGAAYNKQLGTDKTGDTVVGYFDASQELIAWSYMLDWTTGIGMVADSWRLDVTWRDAVASDHTDRKMVKVVSIVRPMTEADL